MCMKGLTGLYLGPTYSSISIEANINQFPLLKKAIKISLKCSCAGTRLPSHFLKSREQICYHAFWPADFNSSWPSDSLA